MGTNVIVPAGNLNPSVSVTIANTATISSLISCGGMSLCGFIIPAAFTGTAISFLAGVTSGGTFYPVKDATGAAISYVVAPSGYYSVDPRTFQGINFLKIVSGTAEAGGRTLVCSLKGI